MRYLPTLLAIALFAGGAASAQTPAAPAAPRPPGLLLTSTGITDGGIIPDKYTQASASAVSPPLSWTNVPAGTVSFTLILHDPDTAPGKSATDILHWLAFNIPGTATSLPEGVPNIAQLPDGTVQINNLRNAAGFMGPGAGPPVYHHYTFELFALDTKLMLDATATRAQVLAAMDGHVVGKAALEARFHR